MSNNPDIQIPSKCSELNICNLDKKIFDKTFHSTIATQMGPCTASTPTAVTKFCTNNYVCVDPNGNVDPTKVYDGAFCFDNYSDCMAEKDMPSTLQTLSCKDKFDCPVKVDCSGTIPVLFKPSKFTFGNVFLAFFIFAVLVGLGYYLYKKYFSKEEDDELYIENSSNQTDILNKNTVNEETLGKRFY